MQYLYVVQDSKCYMTHSTAQVQSNSQVTDISLTETKRLKDGHLLMSLRFFSLPMGIGPISKISQNKVKHKQNPSSSQLVTQCPSNILKVQNYVKL